MTTNVPLRLSLHSLLIMSFCCIQKMYIHMKRDFIQQIIYLKLNHFVVFKICGPYIWVSYHTDTHSRTHTHTQTHADTHIHTSLLSHIHHMYVSLYTHKYISFHIYASFLKCSVGAGEPRSARACLLCR